MTFVTKLRVGTVALLAGAALGGGVPAGALAQGCQGQPGTSALEQYCEAIGTGTGGRENPGSRGSGSGSGSGSGVSGSTQRSLQGAGADGAAVSALAGGSGDSGSGGSGSGGSGGGSSSNDDGGASGSGSGSAGASDVKGVTVEGPTAPDGSPLKAATQAASSGPVAGQAVTWGLVGLTALGAIGAVFLRRRTLTDAAAASDTGSSAGGDQ